MKIYYLSYELSVGNPRSVGAGGGLTIIPEYPSRRTMIRIVPFTEQEVGAHDGFQCPNARWRCAD